MEKEKLIFKVDKGTMGSYNYIGFRKWVGKSPALCSSGSDYLLINPGEYMELGFVDKPDIANWNNDISDKEFKLGNYGDALGNGKLDDIKLLLKTHSNFKQLD